MSRTIFSLSLMAFLLATSITRGEVGDPTIRTDHHFYPGEGAFQTAADVVAYATSGAKSDQDRALALYNWLLNHQWHLASPQEPNGAEQTADTKAMENYEMMVTDAGRARFSYGYGLCGTVHAWNEPYWKALGFNARRRAFPGHTNSEIEYGGSWHAFDTDMAGLIFRKDGVVAGYEDVVADPSIILRGQPPVPCYPFAWPGDRRTMEQGWKQVARGGNWYKMYHSGYEAHPGIVHLRAGETFTRYYDRDHFGGVAKRRFWHHQPGGPSRNWSFVNQGTPRHDGDQSNCRGEATYCNGEFVYRPDIKSDRFREGLVQATGNVAGRGSSPALHANDGQDAACTFEHFSPYVMCGDPEDDANPMTGNATDGFVIQGHAVGEVLCEVSVDRGMTWRPARQLSGRFKIDETNSVKGHYGWLVRFRWTGNNGLDDLQFTTVTQVCQTIYPRLKAGGSQVAYRAASRAVTPLLPNLHLPADRLDSSASKPTHSENVRYVPRSTKNRLAYQTTNNKPGTVTFKIASPKRLAEVTAAVRFSVSVPPPPNCDFHCDVSFDDGRSWQPLAEAKIPTDNEYSSGWMSGRCATTADSQSALVRVTFYAGGRPTGIMDAQFYAVHQTERPQSVKLIYAWKEEGKIRQHEETIAAGTDRHEFNVPTGREVIDEFIRLEAL